VPGLADAVAGRWPRQAAAVVIASLVRPWSGCEDKIGAEHRDRAAIVYVRQSSRQVLEHGESTRLQ